MQKRERALSVTADFDNINAERKSIFGERIADNEEREFNNRFIQAENDLNLKRNLRDDSILILNNIKETKQKLLIIKLKRKLRF